jgi:hypothetical protein
MMSALPRAPRREDEGEAGRIKTREKGEDARVGAEDEGEAYRRR